MEGLSLHAIRDESSGEVYPRYLFERARTALVLFAAGFYGKQDAYWIQEAGMVATCVDLDAEKLAAMQAIYSPGWEWHATDVFGFAATAHHQGRHWDLVSLDPPTGLFDATATLLPVWCQLADQAVVMGAGKDTKIEAPPGWVERAWRPRSMFRGGVYWVVLEREVG